MPADSGDRAAPVTQYARNPERNVEIGGMRTVFVPRTTRLPRPRPRPAVRTIEDFRNFVKLAYMSPYLHHSGVLRAGRRAGRTERHLDMVYSHIRYSDKPLLHGLGDPERARDTVEMARLTFGAGYLEDHTVVASLINAPNSPLRLGLGDVGAAPRRGESGDAPSRRWSFTARWPRSRDGRLCPTLAEALGGMTFVQLTRSGAPVILARPPRRCRCSLVRRRSGPGARARAVCMAALARRLGVRSGGSLCGSKIADAQAS